jgi:hypothetical protein
MRRLGRFYLRAEMVVAEGRERGPAARLAKDHRVLEHWLAVITHHLGCDGVELRWARAIAPAAA